MKRLQLSVTTFQIAIPLLALLSTLSFQNCSGMSADTSGTTDTSSSASTTTVTNNLSLTQADQTIAPNASLALTAYGGTAPYTYTLYSGPGTINGSIFSAPSNGLAIIKVTDAIGSVGYFDITVSDGSTATTVITPTPTPTGAATGTTQPVYRFYKNMHFYTLLQSEGTGAGFSYEGVSFMINNGITATATAPVYRCYDAATGAHWLSGDSYCGSRQSEGLMGYISPIQVANTVPLYCYRNTASGDWLLTVSQAEGAASGYDDNFVLGYVYTQ